jgi:hypothetical protein
MNDYDDNDTSCSLPQWEALLAKTRREILAALDRWKEAAQPGKNQ